MNHTDNAIDSIERIEALIGRELPADYRSWLTAPESDNPVPAQTVVPTDPPHKESVTSIYSTEDLLQEVEMAVDMNAAGSPDYPPGMIPIGENGMGDCVLLSLRELDYGVVYFLFHEESNPDDNLWGLYALGPTFADWLRSLVRGEVVQPTNEVAPIHQANPTMTVSTPTKPWWRFW